MKSKIIVAALLLFTSATIFYSCAKEDSNSGGGQSQAALSKPHFAKIFLTDDQTPIFDSIFIDFQKLEVKVEDDSLSNDGWVTVDIHAGVYNILQLRNGLDTLLATGTLPNARIQKIRLTLGSQNSVMLKGQSFPLNLHDDDREIVIDVRSGDFDISSPGQLAFWIDFDASHSIQIDNSGHGNHNGYRLKSHLRVFCHTNAGSIEGRVLPNAADAIVMAINGTDTTIAIPEDSEGEYKIVGLDAGTYSVLFDGRNGYVDTLIQSVVVRKAEDTHLPVITLHQ